MVETALYAQWIPRLGVDIHYANWRNGKQEGEVDIVGLNIAKQKPAWAVEVKWTDRYYERPTELISLKYFMDKNNMDYAIVTTITQFGSKQFDERKLQFLPTACYAYTVAENTLKQAKSSYGL